MKEGRKKKRKESKGLREVKRRRVGELEEAQNQYQVKIFEQNRFEITVLVSRDLDIEGILGLETMKKMGAVIDLQHNLLIIEDFVYDYGDKDATVPQV